jgi:HAD superfamily hydrolase (TIGR01509 family)
MTNVKAVLFDMDGTLVDSIPFHKESWISFLKKHDIELDPDQFQSQNRGNIDEMIRKFFGKSISDEKLIALGNEKEVIYRDLYRPHIREIDGLTNFLQTLKNEPITIALATMGDSNNINFILDTIKVQPFFQFITGGHEISKGKPDPEIYELSLKKMNLQNTECVVFEDSTDGVCAAKMAGIKVIGVTTSHTAEELKRAGCEFAISDFTGISIANLNGLLS